MRAKVLFFGILKDVAGCAAEESEFPEGADLRAVFESYAARFPPFRQMAASIVVAATRNSPRSPPSSAMAMRSRFLPPVSGGSAEAGALETAADGHYFCLTRHAIDTRALIAHLLTGAEGAVVTFEGTVRNNTKGRPTQFLDYDCYEPMALKMMAQIGREIARPYAVGRVAMVHRLGRMLVGETSVAVIVTARIGAPPSTPRWKESTG